MARAKKPRRILDVELVPDADEKAQTKRMWPKGTPMDQVKKIK